MKSTTPALRFAVSTAPTDSKTWRAVVSPDDHVRLEALDAGGARTVRESLQQARTEAAVLPFVDDDHGRSRDRWIVSMSHAVCEPDTRSSLRVDRAERIAQRDAFAGREVFGTRSRSCFAAFGGECCDRLFATAEPSQPSSSANGWQWLSMNAAAGRTRFTTRLCRHQQPSG